MMIYRNAKFIIYKRGVNITTTSINSGLNRRWLGRLCACDIKYINEKVLKKIYILAKHLDIHPVDLLFMEHIDFRFKYTDPNVKEYIEVESNFIFNAKLYLNNAPDRRLFKKIINGYRYRFPVEDNRYQKVKRILNGRIKYNIEDVVIFARAINVKPGYLMFGVE